MKVIVVLYRKPHGLIQPVNRNVMTQEVAKARADVNVAAVFSTIEVCTGALIASVCLEDL